MMMTLIQISLLGLSCRADDYSCRAAVFMPDGYSDKTIVWSPDHQKYVLLSSKPEHAEADEGTFSISVYAGNRLLKTFAPKDLSAATFVKWSSDSKGLYVMWSDGGALGGYHVRAFLVRRGQAIESPGPKVVAEDFSKYHSCKTRGNNLYAVRWLHGSKQLLLRPAVYPTGDCAPETALSAEYLVTTADGKIVNKSAVREFTPFVDGCPSDVFPSAFSTQHQIEEYRKSQAHDLIPEHKIRKEKPHRLRHH